MENGIENKLHIITNDFQISYKLPDRYLSLIEAKKLKRINVRKNPEIMLYIDV